MILLILRFRAKGKHLSTTCFQHDRLMSSTLYNKHNMVWFVTKPMTTVSQDVQTRFPVQLALIRLIFYAKFIRISDRKNYMLKTISYFIINI